MRALLLIALLAPAAAAQDVQTPPAPDVTATPLRSGENRCGAPATMPTPFAVDPGAAAVEVEMGGPAPVPMPNLCDGAPALAANGTSPFDLGRFPEMDYEHFRHAPPAVRELLPFRPERPAIPRVDPDVLQRYLDRLPEGADLFDLLPTPDAPVAPPGDRE